MLRIGLVAPCMLLGLCACGSPSVKAEQWATVTDRVEFVDQRIAGAQDRIDELERSLDFMLGSVDDLSTLASAYKTRDEQLAREREARITAREQARIELRTRLGLDGTPPPPPPRPVPSAEATAPSFPEEFRPPPPAGPLPRTRPTRIPPSSRHLLEGASESIWCDTSTEGWTRCGIERAFFDYLVTNEEFLARQWRVVPLHELGRHRGFRVSSIRRGSVPNLFRIKNGDIITAIDGTSISSIEQTAAIMAGASKRTHFELDLERRGTPHILTVDVVE